MTPVNTKVRERVILKRIMTVAKFIGLHPLRLALQPGVEAGWPDVLVFGSGRHLLGIEAKAPGGKVTPLQKTRGRTIQSCGFDWVVCDGVQKVDFTLLSFGAKCTGLEFITWEEFQKTDRDEIDQLIYAESERKKS